MQRAKLFAYVNNNNIDIKHILHDKQFHLEQKEIIQNVLERKDSMAVLPTVFGKSMCYVLSPLFGQGKIIFVFLVVICNSLLLLKSLFVYMQIISHDTLR
jgi:superfamily II DNA helicase RecQ